MKRTNGTLLVDIFDNLNKDIFLSSTDKKMILKFKDLVKNYFINVNPEFLEEKTESKIYDSEGKTIIANENVQSIILTNFGENIALSISFESKDKRRENICFNYLKESKICKVDSRIEQETKYLSSTIIKYSGLIHDNGSICFKIDKINAFEYEKTDTSLLTKSNEVIYDGEKSEPDITSYSELTRKINDAIEMVNIRKKLIEKEELKMFNIELLDIILENESYPVLFREQLKNFMESVYPGIAFEENQENVEISISNSDEEYSCSITHTCDNTTSRITVSYLNNIEEVVNVEAEHEETFDDGKSRIISYFGKLYPNNQEYFEIESVRNLYSDKIEEYCVTINEPIDDSNKVSAFSYNELTRKLADFSKPEMAQKKVKNNK